MKLIEKQIYIEGLKISYYDNENNKEILFFAHGWGGDKNNLAAIFNYLLNDFRVISIDLPGFGKSDKPPDSAGSEYYSSIIIKFFDKLNIKSINYIGHSFGGKIGIIISANYPQYIKKLILINSAGLKAKRTLSWYIKVYFFKLLKFIYLNILKKDNIEQLKNKFGSSDYKNASNMRDILVKVVNEDFSHLLKKINIPVFLYWGDKDKDTPLWMAYKMKKMIKDCGLFIVKNGGHYSFLDDNRIIYIIKSFCLPDII